jgi:hypothetical protein
MFGFGKPKTEAEKLVDHVKTAKEAEAKGDWELACAHYNHLQKTVKGVDSDLYGLFGDADVRCREHIREARRNQLDTKALRKELGLS